MIHRVALGALLLWSGVARAQSAIVVRLDDAGPGPGPLILAQALAGPHTVIPPGTTSVVLSRDSTYRQTVIVLGRDVSVEGTVNGDVIVVGGDVYTHPRAAVTGRAIAFGGAAYESALATVGGGTLAFRDFTYDIAAIPGGFALRYRSLVDQPTTTFSLPGQFGFRLPSYDRTDGLSVPVAFAIAVPGTQAVVEPGITYRSNLGAIDPSLSATDPINSGTTIRGSIARGTFSNEDWIWPDLMNSAETILVGHDNQNHFRAIRGEASITRRWETPTLTVAPYVGGRWERARSVGPDSTSAGGPWSFHNRHSHDDMLRLNPRIDDGTIASILAGAHVNWSDQGVIAHAYLDVEGGRLSDIQAGNGVSPGGFAQSTFDGRITFPTFGLQTIRLDGHAVVQLAGRTPRQRWAYVGGPGSIPTLDLLDRGGDELVYFDGRYNIPLERVTLPFGGPPILTIRQILGGADVGRWPTLAQATGLRLAVSVVYIEFLYDPVHRVHHTGVGITLAR